MCLFLDLRLHSSSCSAFRFRSRRMKEKGPDYEILNLHDAAASSDGKSVAGV
jgi:hypothetical protein